MDRKIVEALISGKGVNALCRDLGVGKRRVAYLREKAREYGYLDGKVSLPPYPEALFPDPIDGRSLQRSAVDLEFEKVREWIEERLKAGWEPITVFEELPLEVARSSFYRYLHRHSLIRLGESSRKTLRQEIVYAPGEALILDWGKLCNVPDPLTGKNRELIKFRLIFNSLASDKDNQDPKTTLLFIEALRPNRILKKGEATEHISSIQAGMLNTSQ